MDSGVPHGVCFAVVAGDKSGACFEQEVRQETGAQAAGYGNLWHVTTNLLLGSTWGNAARAETMGKPAPGFLLRVRSCR